MPPYWHQCYLSASLYHTRWHVLHLSRWAGEMKMSCCPFSSTVVHPGSHWYKENSSLPCPLWLIWCLVSEVCASVLVLLFPLMQEFLPLFLATVLLQSPSGLAWHGETNRRRCTKSCCITEHNIQLWILFARLQKLPLTPMHWPENRQKHRSFPSLQTQRYQEGFGLAQSSFSFSAEEGIKAQQQWSPLERFLVCAVR